MDLATIIIIATTVLGGVLYCINKYVHQRTLMTKAHLLAKFKDIKAKNIKLQDELEALIVKYDAWGKTAFTDTDTNFVEYLDVLREKLEIEFSDSEFKKLSNMQFERDEISECLEKFSYHQDVLIALRHDLNMQRAMLQPPAHGTIEFG